MLSFIDENKQKKWNPLVEKVLYVFHDIFDSHIVN